MGVADTTAVVDSLAGLAAQLDPDRVDDAQVEPMLAALALAARLIDGMTTRLARRLDGAHWKSPEVLSELHQVGGVSVVTLC